MWHDAQSAGAAAAGPSKPANHSAIHIHPSCPPFPPARRGPPQNPPKSNPRRASSPKRRAVSPYRTTRTSPNRDVNTRRPPSRNSIRIPGAITREKLDILRKADVIYLDEIRKAGLYDDIWQAFAVLLPVRTVGVMGDGRTYDHVCALRAVTSVDGMTADFFPFDMNVLGRTATRIINEVRGINRVVYDVTSKPPGTIEWE